MDNRDSKRQRSLVSSGSDAECIVDIEVDTKESRFDKLFNKLSDVSDVLNGLVRSVNDINTKINQIEVKVDSHEVILCELRDKIESNEETTRNIKSQLELSIAEAKNDISSIGAKMQRVADRVSATEAKLIDQEARSRRQNLLFFGVAEKEGENCTKIIEDIIGKLNVSTRKNPLQRAHRHGAPKSRNDIGHGKKNPRPIIVNFLDFQDKEAVRLARKKLAAPISISEDFPFEIREARKKLLPELKELKNKNKNAFIAYPARLICDGQLVNEIKVTSR